MLCDVAKAFLGQKETITENTSGNMNGIGVTIHLLEVQHAYHLYFEVFHDSVLFGRLKEAISQACEDAHEVKICFMFLEAYIELSVSKQLTILEYLKIFRFVTKENEHNGLVNSLTKIFEKQRSNDKKVLEFLCTLLTSSKQRKIIFDL